MTSIKLRIEMWMERFGSVVCAFSNRIRSSGPCGRLHRLLLQTLWYHLRKVISCFLMRLGDHLCIWWIVWDLTHFPAGYRWWLQSMTSFDRLIPPFVFFHVKSNKSKCKHMHLGPETDYNYMMEENMIANTMEEKDLGVILLLPLFLLFVRQCFLYILYLCPLVVAVLFLGNMVSISTLSIPFMILKVSTTSALILLYCSVGILRCFNLLP
jgi:hypothetical protein